MAIWRFFAEKRAGAGSMAELVVIMEVLGDKWPRPLFQFILGRASAEQALAAAAAAPDPAQRLLWQSQAHCIIAEWLTLNDQSEAARPHFQASKDLGLQSAQQTGGTGQPLTVDTVIEFALARARLRPQAQ
jgi:hypothetical protein